MLSTVKEEQRPQANSFANLSYNLLGYFPAPALYGLVDNLSGLPKPRYGATMIMYMTVVSFTLIVAAYIAIFKGRIFGAPIEEDHPEVEIDAMNASIDADLTRRAMNS